MNKLFKLKCTVQNYAWGDTEYLPNLLGVDNIDEEPFAELWMGAHPKAPSIVVENDTPLNVMISKYPEHMLGITAAAKFNNKLPYLFKVLSSKQPLSIQAHPNLEQAQKGFVIEEAVGIKMNDFYRNYKDDNHKPELICALTEFHAMCGFRSADDILNNFELVQIDEILSKYETFSDTPDEVTLKKLFAEILRSDSTKKEKLLDKLLHNFDKLEDDLTISWIKKMMIQYPDDIGVLAPLFLNTFVLKPGQAVYLKAGVPHAYLKGTGIEIMANSDNVLRGGLTSKNIDVDELLKIIDVDMTFPNIQSDAKTEPYKKYDIPINEFSLEKLEVNGKLDISNDKPTIIIQISGNTKLECEAEKLSLATGEVCFIAGSASKYNVRGKGLIFIASTNI